MKKALDWENLGFNYLATDWRYSAKYHDGAWEEGTLIRDPNVSISESAGVLQYCQEVFEGLKAYTTRDGHIVAFRPDLNAERMMSSAERMEMPFLSKETFLNAVDMVVKSNESWVPPYGSGASFYLRPYLFATGPVLGVKPADTYEFRMFGTPVGPYFKGSCRSIILTVSDFDRAAPHGTGHIKAGLNYAMSLHASVTAHHNGFDENLFPDSATRSYVEETGGANILFIRKDGTLVSVDSPSILPSITRRSILYVARNLLGMKVEERRIPLSELGEFAECGLCGTAAVITPVRAVNDHGREICFPATQNGYGPVTQRLYDTLKGIQMGDVEAPQGWIHTIL
jgi:branched-chain amino acid aminotransferase